MANKTLSRKIDKGLLKFKLLEPGDHVLIAVSGGKDSLTLAWFLGHKQKHFPIPFKLSGVHIQGDFPGCGKSDVMQDLMDCWGIPFEVVDVPVMARLKPGKSMNCYWCSTQRRMELIRYAGEKGCNKIALGHHLDDILETFFMNMLNKGELSTMLPKLAYDRYPYTVIRPLCYVRESEILDFSREKGLLEGAGNCAWGSKSKRLQARALVESMAEKGGPRAKENMFEALCRPIHRYMPYSLLESAGSRDLLQESGDEM